MPTQLLAHCPRCLSQVSGDDSLIGQVVTCPACQATFEYNAAQPKATAYARGPSSRGDTLRTMAAETSRGDRSNLGNVTGDGEGSRPAPAQGRLDRFELIEQLGQGAFGRVYKAYDPQLDRYVALKIPIIGENDKHLIQRLRAEAKAAARLRHPNIVPIHDVGQIDGWPYLVSHFVEGETLETRIKKSESDFREAAQWIRQLAEALAYAHAQDVVHRDIKPANILVDHSGVPQILDFGIAKRLNAASALTADGSLLGTPAYMSPEQARGKVAEIGPASDQYSLGVVLYELLTGNVPFSGSLYSVIAQIAHADPPAPHLFRTNLPERLCQICLKAMHKEPASRYTTAADLAEDLGRWLDGAEEQPNSGWLSRLASGGLVAGGVFAGVCILWLASVVFMAAERPGSPANAPQPMPQTAPQYQAGSAPDAVLITSVRGPGQRIDVAEAPGSHKAAVELLLSAAEEGDIDSQFLLGEKYEYGHGVAKNDEEAVAWFRRAAERGHALAQYSLGAMYEHGRGVPQDLSLALVWYRKAAAQGESVASDAVSRFEKPVTTAPPVWERNITNSIAMELVLVPAGQFVMGSPLGETGHHKDEVQHDVRITRPFYLGKHEVTQGEYAAIMGDNPSRFKSSRAASDGVESLDTTRLPVENVAWEQAIEFCRRLSVKEGKAYRLPTEAEWEYACRAGSLGAFHTGDSMRDSEANCDWSYPLGTASQGVYRQQTTRVGSFVANAFGLYDMHGNVSEWCADWYDRKSYGSSSATDPTGPPLGTGHVIRGGSWYCQPLHCRSAYRVGRAIGDSEVGFRVALPVAAK